MFAKLSKLLYPMFRVNRIGVEGSLYLWRLHLTPFTPWGSVMLHVFRRGDQDRAPHDHPWDFWTLPLTHSYFEMVCGSNNLETPTIVPRWKWSFRPAEYRHRVCYPAGKHEDVQDFVDKHTWKGWPMVTLVVTTTRKRTWGFWPIVWEKGDRVIRRFVPWKQFLGVE